MTSYESYTPSSTDLETYKKLNPSWAAQRGSSTSSWNENEHAAEWLSAPSQWTAYYDSTKANYAIGSPTVEMYVASYNQVSHTIGNYTLGATYDSTMYPGYKYTVNGTQQNSGWNTNTNTLDYTGYNSMYAGENGNKLGWWWLASPSINYSSSVCTVNNNGANFSYEYNSRVGGVCPLVALKPGIGVELENEIADAETIAENPQNYYGKKISNYTAGGQTYRIFYVDKQNDFGDGKNTIYLKADYNEYLRGTVNDSISNLTEEDIAVYKKMNKSWAAERGEKKSEWGVNEKRAALLCAPSQWTKYCDSSKANYAIGGPSLEMYIASYNQVSHTKVNYKLGTTYRETNYPGYIYTLNGKQSTVSNSDYYTGSNTLDYSGYKKMYCGESGTISPTWWLASPSSNSSDTICEVQAYNASLTAGIENSASGMCPLISLKSGVKLTIQN